MRYDKQWSNGPKSDSALPYLHGAKRNGRTDSGVATIAYAMGKGVLCQGCEGIGGRRKLSGRHYRVDDAVHKRDHGAMPTDVGGTDV